MTTSTVSDLDTARLLLEKLGVSPEDLLNATAVGRVVPTFAEYIPVVSAAVGDGARGTYGSYWKRIAEAWPDRRWMSHLCRRSSS